ncbi:MAG: hypothetical protein R3183_08545 [Oleiphilaceae bacterium]|nr:hypothetical protein [Oleiphilaceae bacterium]
MKKIILISLVAGSMLAGISSVQAADVKGDVKADVKAGVILQNNKGIANKNEANIGSVTGKSTDVGGDVKTKVKVGAVIQNNKGIANKNEVNIGSVTD